MNLLDSVLTRLKAESSGHQLPSAEEMRILAAECGDDGPRLKRWIKRRMAGEPMAYVLGWIEFRGMRFAVDKRAYVTDPELTHLVDVVLARGRALLAETGHGPLIAEIGVGCGSLALALKRELPEARIVGLDLDPDPLALAKCNATAHGLALELIESDLFDGWPSDLGAPDLIFGDPPWGDETSLYSGDRTATHYRAMPAASAFPLGGRTGLHAQILRAVSAQGWSSEVWLNGGVLAQEELAAAVPRGFGCKIISPTPGVSLLCCGLSK